MILGRDDMYRGRFEPKSSGFMGVNTTRSAHRRQPAAPLNRIPESGLSE